AATGGILGQAGAYSGQSFDTIGSESFYQSNGHSSNVYGSTFDSGIDLSTASIPMTNGNFNSYTDFGDSDQFQRQHNAPFEYQSYDKYQINNPNIRRTQGTSSVSSSLNNDVSIEQIHFNSIPLSIPNLGLNMRVGNSRKEEIIPDEQLVDDTALLNNNTQITNGDDTNIDNNTNTSSTEIKRPLSVDNSDRGLLQSQSNSNFNGFPIEGLDQQTLASAGKIYYDPNPQIIKRQGTGSVTYKQNILIRFLQPPPIPAPGPLIIKEVRNPQPPPLPPLVIKQRPTPPKTPPPLILRERPPPLPQSIQSKVITRQLPAEPPPPRAVIIERLPPLPPKPRDIIIERWLPYQLSQKRKVLVERAPAIKEYPKPKNVIITYEPVQARIVRQFQKLGITREDPNAYISRYGAQLRDAITLETEARKAGVIEDISPPSVVGNAQLKSTYGFDADPLLTTNNGDWQFGQLGEDNAFNYGTAALTNGDEQIVGKSRSSSSVKNFLLSTPDKDLVQEQEQQVIENGQDQNVQPFYISDKNDDAGGSGGDNIQQTLQKLGIDISGQTN
ncbi:unnamed protein product, partial [Didymodactylos carnosus]